MAAKALLDGIETECGLDFLSSIRYHTSPPGSTFFAPLDAILSNYDPHATEISTLNRGNVIEIQGPAASGKTQCLQFFAMTTCMPRDWQVSLSVRGSSRPPRPEKIAIGGREKCVAVIDCDGRFDSKRTYHLVHSHLVRRVQEHAATIPSLYSAEAEPEALHEETLQALKRIHLFRPTSSASLAATLLRLPEYCMKNCQSELAFLLIDNVSAFYWQDRYQLEQQAKSNKKHLSRSSPMVHVLQALHEVRKSTGVVTVMTNWAFPAQGDRHPTSSSPFYRQHLNKPYPAPFVPAPDGTIPPAPEIDAHHPLSTGAVKLNVTHHITLHHPQTKAVPKDISLEHAIKEEPYRVMEQQELGSMAFVRLPGIEEGDPLGRWDLVIRPNTVEGL
ncbi:hypothetical protein P389DRAFT_194826 [Cystobasidium minutum MCA 4210]|uniref:uncharacterized protein n=1 Tax=Cystobasidium minutum MCA 4210 TaxID=1397322 RepID=UPI0034D01559|eukprot:jgi/Rhomi1/194826/gm1.3040_g